MPNTLENKSTKALKDTAKKKRNIIPTGKYINEVKWRHRTAQEQNDIADEFLSWYVKDSNNLFFSVFFAARFISSQVLTKWRRSNEYFDYCMELAEQIREQRLQDRLLTTTAPSGIIFLLKNLHGYRNEPDPTDSSLDQATINTYQPEIVQDA